MDWIKVTIYTTTKGIDAVCGNLYQVGITGTEIEDENEFSEFLEETKPFWDYVDDDLVKSMQKETTVSAYVSDNESGHEMLLLIKEAMLRLKGYDVDNEFGTLKIDLGNLNEEDWANNWKKFFHPLKIGEKIMIKPEWEELTEETDRIIFNVNPGMTFGTGSHHTTQLCIEELEKYVTTDCDVLDLGCGSGILSVISLMLGAKSALAVDIDPNCINIAMANAKRNNVDTDNYEVIAGNIITDEEIVNKVCQKKYPVILANIVADVIIAIIPTVKKCIEKDGIFITSGIIIDRIDDVKKALSEFGFKVISTKTQKDWAELTCKLED